jgi:diguanylate cyclase (GGDEF)-like protein/PAS domain S-box-containing protein
VFTSEQTVGALPRDRHARAAVYRAMVGRVPHVLLVIDAQGMILDITEEVAEKLGYEPDEVVGQQVFDFLHPADHHRAALGLLHEASDVAAQAESIVCRLRKADGTWPEFEVQGFNQFHDPEIGGLLITLRDISARRMSDRVLAAGDYLFSALTTVATDATTIFDANGQRVYSSPSLGVMLGYTTAEILAIPPRGLVHPEDLGAWRAATQQALATENGTARTEVRLMCSNGSTVWIEATVVNLLHDAGVGGVVVHARDIDQRRHVEGVLRRQANCDALTGLANRFAFMEALALACAPDRTDRGGLAVLFCDLDNFKRINDTYGHKAGDQLLQTVANGIELAVRPSDFVARIGGDEFCVLGYGLATPADAVALADRVRSHIATSRGASHRVGVSIGVAWTQADEVDADVLLTSADRAMYRAKRQGSNLVEVIEVGDNVEPPPGASKENDLPPKSAAEP